MSPIPSGREPSALIGFRVLQKYRSRFSGNLAAERPLHFCSCICDIHRSRSPTQTIIIQKALELIVELQRFFCSTEILMRRAIHDKSNGMPGL